MDPRCERGGHGDFSRDSAEESVLGSEPAGAVPGFPTVCASRRRARAAAAMAPLSSDTCTPSRTHLEPNTAPPQATEGQGVDGVTLEDDETVSLRSSLTGVVEPEAPAGLMTLAVERKPTGEVLPSRRTTAQSTASSPESRVCLPACVVGFYDWEAGGGLTDGRRGLRNGQVPDLCKPRPMEGCMV